MAGLLRGAPVAYHFYFSPDILLSVTLIEVKPFNLRRDVSKAEVFSPSAMLSFTLPSSLSTENIAFQNSLSFTSSNDRANSDSIVSKVAGFKIWMNSLA